MKHIIALTFILLSTFAYAEEHSVTVNNTAYSFTTKQDLKLFKNYYSKLGVGLDKLAEEMVKGRKEFVGSIIKTKRFDRYKAEGKKRDKAVRSWDSIARQMLNNGESSGYRKLPIHATALTKYIVANYDSLVANKKISVPVNAIKVEDNILANNRIAEENNRIAAELRKINAKFGK